MGQKRVYKMQSEYMDQYAAQQKRAQRRKKALVRRLIVFGFLFAAIVFVMVHFHVNQRTLLADKQIEYEHLQGEMTQLKQDETELIEEINLLNDEEYILDIARTSYFLSKEGELIFQLDELRDSY